MTDLIDEKTSTKFEQLRGFTDEYSDLFGTTAMLVNNMSGSDCIGIECRSLTELTEDNRCVMILPKEQALKLAVFIMQEYAK